MRLKDVTIKFVLYSRKRDSVAKTIFSFRITFTILKKF